VYRAFGRQKENAMSDVELVQGTLELLVLKTLSLEPMHGWGIASRIEQLSQNTFSVNQGSLYPALQRMKRKGWVRSAWQVTENSRRARYYELTAEGRRQLTQERRLWEKSVNGVNSILAATLSEVTP
jgi:transcriptional regulator